MWFCQGYFCFNFVIQFRNDSKQTSYLTRIYRDVKASLCFPIQILSCVLNKIHKKQIQFGMAKVSALNIPRNTLKKHRKLWKYNIFLNSILYIIFIFMIKDSPLLSVLTYCIFKMWSMQLNYTPVIALTGAASCLCKELYILHLFDMCMY